MPGAVRTGSLAAALVLALGCTAGGQERTPPPMPPMPPMMRPPEASITVVGSGSVSARPDTADVTAGVVAQAPTAAQALAQNTASMENVMKAVTAAGIPERDVQTTN